MEHISRYARERELLRKTFFNRKAKRAAVSTLKWFGVVGIFLAATAFYIYLELK